VVLPFQSGLARSLPSSRRCRVVAAVTVAVCLLAVGACARRETDVQRATREGLLLFNNGTEPAELDPQLATGVPEARILDALFEGLTRQDPVDLKALPGVAERWDVSSDGLIYTFHLRADARWSDGAPVTAGDFVVAARRLLTPALASDLAEQLYLLEGAEDFYTGRAPDFSAVGYRALDARTVEMRLRYPKSYLPQVIASRAWFPIPVHVLEKLGGLEQRGSPWTRAENIVGNGPFVMSEWRQRQFLTVTRSPTYWNRANVKLNAVRFFPIESESSDLDAFRAGQAHKTNTIPVSKIATWRRDHPELVWTQPRSGTYFYGLNVERPPLNDVRVRRALALAVDREALVRDVTRRGEKPAYHYTVDGTGGYVCRTNLPHDPDEARRLLAAAGFPGGRGFPRIAVLYNTKELHLLIAEALQEMWRLELGIDVQLRNQEWGVYLNSMNAHDYDITRAGLFVDPFDPWQFLRTYTSSYGFNRTGWANPEYDRLIDALEAAADPVTREALAQEAEALLMQEMPIIPLYFYVESYLVDASVCNWSDNPMQVLPLQEAWVE